MDTAPDDYIFDEVSIEEVEAALTDLIEGTAATIQDGTVSFV
jgi:hypothetical protein